MRPGRAALPLIILALALIAGPVAAAGDATAPSEQLSAPEAARRDLRDRLDRLLDREEKVRRDLAELRRELADLDRRILEGQTQSLELKRRRARLALQQEEAAKERQALEPRLAQLEAAYGRSLRLLYLLGPDGQNWVWASAADAKDALTRTHALTCLLEQHRGTLSEIQRRRRRLTELEESLGRRGREMASLEADLEANGALLVDLKKQQALVVAGLEDHEKILAANIDALAEAQARLARSFALLSEGPPPPAPPPLPRLPSSLGGMGRPAPPVEGRPMHLARRQGRGVTIEARQDAPVRAPWAGRVVFADWLSGYGKVVVLEHGHRVHSVLAYMGTISVEPGQRVRAGQVVGAVDKAGRLYVEVRKEAKPLAPGQWLGGGP